MEFLWRLNGIISIKAYNSAWHTVNIFFFFWVFTFAGVGWGGEESIKIKEHGV